MSWQLVTLVVGLAGLFFVSCLVAQFTNAWDRRNTKAIEAMVANGQAVQHMIGGAIGQAMLTQQPPEGHQ